MTSSLGEAATNLVSTPEGCGITLRESDVGELSLLEDGGQIFHLLLDGKVAIDASWLEQVELLVGTKRTLNPVYALANVLQPICWAVHS